MKKALAVILACIMLISCAACKSESDDMRGPAPQPPAVESVEPTNVEGLSTVLDEIRSYRPGTAGSSLKCAFASHTILYWTATHGNDKDALTAAVTDYFSGFDANAKADFAESFKGVDTFVNYIFDGEEAAINQLSDAGLKINFAINADNYKLLKDLIQKVVA